MSETNDNPALLTALPTEIDAELLVGRLRGHGIEAWVEGGLSSGFRAEAPGSASVYVRSSDLERARRVLGQPKPAEPEPPPPAVPPTTPGPLPKRMSPAMILWIVIAWLLLVLIIVVGIAA
jgi:hypothetical protein